MKHTSFGVTPPPPPGHPMILNFEGSKQMRILFYMLTFRTSELQCATINTNLTNTYEKYDSPLL